MREYMMNQIANRFGLEDPWTVSFCLLAATEKDDGIVKEMFLTLMDAVVGDE